MCIAKLNVYTSWEIQFCYLPLQLIEQYCYQFQNYSHTHYAVGLYAECNGEFWSNTVMKYQLRLLCMGTSLFNKYISFPSVCLVFFLLWCSFVVLGNHLVTTAGLMVLDYLNIFKGRTFFAVVLKDLVWIRSGKGNFSTARKDFASHKFWFMKFMRWGHKRE